MGLPLGIYEKNGKTRIAGADEVLQSGTDAKIEKYLSKNNIGIKH